MTMKTKKTLHRFTAVTAVLLTFCLVFMMPAAADGTPVNKAVISDVQYNTLTEALNSVTVNTETTIEIYGTVALTSGRSNLNVIIEGKTEDAKITIDAPNVGEGCPVYMDGSIITFKNLELDPEDQNYNGFARATKVVYEKCDITGQLHEYAGTAEYINCVFQQPSMNYNSWVYAGNDVTFRNCEFQSGGHALLICKDGERTGISVKIIDCIFTSSGTQGQPWGTITSTGEVKQNGYAAAIEIDSSNMDGTCDVVIQNCTYISNDSEKPFSGLVRHKHGEKAKITVKNSVSYDMNGGTGTMETKEVTYSYDTTATVATSTTKAPWIFPGTLALTETTLPACTFTAPTGKVFYAWEVNGESKMPGDSILVLKDTTVKALWEDAPTYTVTVTASPTEGGTATASPNTAVEGADIDLTAAANDGYEFKEWKVISGDVIITDNKFTMPADDVEITAVFEEKKEGPVTPPTEDTPEPVEPSFEDAVETETTEEGVKVTINAAESSVSTSTDGKTYFIEDEESGVTLTLFFTEEPSSEDSEDPISGVVEHVSANYNYDAGTNSDSDITDIDVHLSIGLDSPDTPLPKINPEFKEELSQKITEKHSDHTPLAMITAETNVAEINNNLTKKDNRVPLVITFMIDASSLAGIDLTQHKFVGYHISGDSVDIIDAHWSEDGGKIIITLNGKHFSSYAVGIAPASSESGEGDDTPSVTPSQRPSSGGSTDTGSGNYNEYPRQADGKAGEISFGSSKDVKAVDLPEGVTGEVKLIAKSTHPAPEGKDTHKVFEINIPNYPTGKAATIKFEMTLADIEAKGLTAADVCLYHFNKETGLWEKLPTTFKVVDGKVYFEAVTTGFSPFAIVFEKGAATPAAGADEPVTPPTETPDVPETPGTLPPVDTPVTPEQPETPATPAPILAVLAGLGAAVVLRRK